MQLKHNIFFKSSQSMTELRDESVDLVVTSPPYPMIKMWDDIFARMSEQSSSALADADGKKAFYSMHESLDKVWADCFRVLKTGGFVCINIGDATRKIGEHFRLYPNHSRITQAMDRLGFDCLPIIHWFKPTNAPNKFMGSGTLPAGAYVTLEHEYILVFRKGGRRIFSDTEQNLRRQSAFFWEERNNWFSDVWDFKGASQLLTGDAESRHRSGAFPFELPYRLINMYSIQSDSVLDPFLGTGTSLAASALCGRSFTGYETDNTLKTVISKSAADAASAAAELTEDRLSLHRDFISSYIERKGLPKHENRFYGFPVITRQETELRIPELIRFKESDSTSESQKYDSAYRDMN